MTQSTNLCTAACVGCIKEILIHADEGDIQVDEEMLSWWGELRSGGSWENMA